MVSTNTNCNDTPCQKHSIWIIVTIYHMKRCSHRVRQKSVWFCQLKLLFEIDIWKMHDEKPPISIVWVRCSSPLQMCPVW